MIDVSEHELSPTRPAGCLTRFRLERYMAGELDPDDVARVIAHLDGCEACRALYSALETEKAAFRSRISFDAFATELERRMAIDVEADEARLDAASGAAISGQVSASSTARIPWYRRGWRAAWDFWQDLSTSRRLGIAMAVIAAMVLLPRLSQDTPYVGFKSGNLEPGQLEVYLLADKEFGPAKSGAVFHEGDRLEFVLNPGSKRYLHLVSVDGEGRLTSFFPREGGESMALERGAEVFLPNSIRLDNYVGLERIFAIYSDEPIHVSIIRDAVTRLVRREGMPLALDRITELPIQGVSQVSFLMVKE